MKNPAFEVRFEARTGHKVKSWIKRTNMPDSAEGYDAFKGYDALTVIVLYRGKEIDSYSRDNGRR